MKSKLRVVLLALSATASAVVLSACVSARDYGAAQPVFERPDSAAPVQINDPEIAKAFEARPQLILPAEVAVFENTYPNWRHFAACNESAADISKNLSTDPAFSKVMIISPTFLNGRVTPRTIRLAGAYNKAPLTLLCDSDYEVHADYSPLSILNITIIGAFIIPSTTVEVHARVGAYLMDTRNGYVYYSGTRTKSCKKFMPSAYGDEFAQEQRRHMVHESYEELLAELKQEVVRLAQKAPEPVK